MDISKHIRDVKIDEINMKILIDKWNITEVKERAIRKNLKKIVFYNGVTNIYYVSKYINSRKHRQSIIKAILIFISIFFFVKYTRDNK